MLGIRLCMCACALYIYIYFLFSLLWDTFFQAITACARISAYRMRCYLGKMSDIYTRSIYNIFICLFIYLCIWRLRSFYNMRRLWGRVSIRNLILLTVPRKNDWLFRLLLIFFFNFSLLFVFFSYHLMRMVPNV